MSKSSLQVPFGVKEIQSIIPHRFPFLFVDRVVEFVDRETIAALKYISANEPLLQGHFPGNPILPGVVILEALAQTGVIHAKLSTDGVAEDKLLVFSGTDKVRFRRQVIPGDTLRLEMKHLKNKLGHWKMEGRALVDGEVAAEALISATEVPAQ